MKKFYVTLDSISVFFDYIYLVYFHHCNRILEVPMSPTIYPGLSRLGAGVIFIVLLLFYDPPMGVGAQKTLKKFLILHILCLFFGFFVNFELVY